MGEETFLSNGYASIPFNVNNSKWNTTLNATQSNTLKVYKDEYGVNKDTLFCYYCMYFITVTTNVTGTSVYRLTVSNIPDVGEEVPVLAPNTNYTVTLPATGTVQQRKFIMDCKDPFKVQA